ncbi:hypothetical protein [Estrella lausannensis]|uniref:Uncharacterized protein n=1 Tax=Estrella lausannensis TaxID=483423 RepID=A0A0H5DNB9_9BACT|nr:hypothetical protein [Estrella lausannensis]CRX37791.1 hypothetical protein ELAC_0435 [Estrella lausannensis]
MGVQGSFRPAVGSFYETNTQTAASATPSVKVLSPKEQKVQAQAAVLTQKLEAKLENLSGKNIQQMDLKQLSVHLKKCDKTAGRLSKLAAKHPQLGHALKDSASVKKFQDHAGEAIAAGQDSIKGKNLSMKNFERSSRLEVKMEALGETLTRRTEASGSSPLPLTEQEMKEMVVTVGDIGKASSEDLAKLEEVLSSKSQMEQLNGYLRSNGAEDLGISEKTHSALKELTYMASRLSDHKQTFEELHQKLTDPTIPPEKRTLGSSETWLLDHIGNAHEHFKDMDLNKAGQCPMLSKLVSPAFSKGNIERIAKHRAQNLKVGDVLLFSGAKYRAYKGHTKTSGDAIQTRLTGSETVHAEVIHTKTKDGHAVNQGLWDKGLSTESTDIGISYYADSYRVKPENLLTSQTAAALKEAGVTDIKSFMEDKYAQAFTKASNEERSGDLVNSRGRRMRSVVPHHLSGEKKQAINEMAQADQAKAICSEYAMIVTFRALVELKADLAKFCEDKGVGEQLKDNAIIGLDTSVKLDSSKQHTGKLAKMLEGMMALGLMEPVAKPAAAMPLQLQEVAAIRSEVMPESQYLDQKIAEASAAHKNLSSDDPRRGVLSAHIQEVRQGVLNQLTGLETTSRQRLQSAQKKHPEDLDLGTLSKELEGKIGSLKQQIAILDAMEGTPRQSSLTNQQKAALEAVKGGKFEEYAPLVNDLSAQELKQIVQEHALASLEGSDNPTLSVPGLISAFMKGINLNDQEKMNEFKTINSDSLVKLNTEAHDVYTKTYRNIVENAALREKTFHEARDGFALALSSASEVFGVDKATVKDIEEFLKSSIKEIENAPADKKSDLIQKHQNTLQSKMVSFNQQISDKIKGADVQQKDAWQKEIQDKLPAYKDKKYQGTAKDHGVVIIAAQWKMPTFIETLYSTVSSNIKAQQALKDSDHARIGLPVQLPL